ncbi:DUF2207 domain-containing protein [Candidatus Woesearchaeota archaeon]|nr:DUF2207 domain-containing protein [Candidatus Woesearchaeota archaeon]
MGKHMMTKKHKGIVFIVAGVLLGLVALDTWAWLNLTMFFAIILVLIGVHKVTCKECMAPCDPETKKK